MKKTYLTLILSSFLILLFYLVSSHPFEIPDEQSHFASTHFLIEEGRMPTMEDTQNLSVEEQKVERIFGIMSQGENKYSYHPEFRLEATNTTIGKYETQIKQFNTPENRTTYTIHQSALYPPLYYWLTSIFYHLVGTKDIILRLFTSRFSSLIISSFVPLIAYLIGDLIFKQKSQARTLAFLTLLFPMFTYIGVGLNSDNLHNFFFALATLYCLKIIKSGWSQKLSLSLGITVGLDLITKPQAYILFPIIFSAILVRWRFEWKQWLNNLIYFILPILVLAGWYELPKLFNGDLSHYYVSKTIYGGLDNFKIYATNFTRTLLKEMIVWYWGVFKWFGVILPKPFWWLANRILLLSTIGLLKKLFKDFKNKKISWELKVIIFSILANLSYLLALFWFDWQFYQEFGQSLGMQARYFMPLLISQIVLIIIGVKELAWTKKLKNITNYGLIFFFLSLQITSLYTQLSSYYDLVSFSTFINQISQYKPFFAKGYWWYLWISVYFYGIISLLKWTLKKK